MKSFNKNIALLLAWLLATQPLLAAVPTGSITLNEDRTAADFEEAPQTSDERVGIELTGTFDDRRAEMRAEKRKDFKPGFGEDGQPAARSPIADLPVVDDKLSAKAASVRAEDELRVLIHLSYLPHGRVLQDTMRTYEDDVNRLEEDRVRFLKQFSDMRSRDTEKDSDDYANMFSMTEEQRAQSRSLNERNEDLSFKIKRDVTEQLRGMIDVSQKPIHDEIDRLGGTVEFSTIAGNTVVALVPAGAVADLGKTPGILRIVEDSMMEGHLNNAAAASMVDPADTSLVGLWDANRDGGIYDPAIIDSGLDDSHPAMQNSTTPLRENFYSWYLVAAIGSAAFDDIISQDDVQGHGTHVAGIVASYGSPGYTEHKGMAFGVEKVVNLKAGWQNTSGTSSMFWSDKYLLVDRALNNTGALQGGTFSDDVDGFNLSYGSATSLDDTDGSRFWDALIDTYNDTPVTISAGNSGPSNTLFSDPAVSYNAITVANANDRGTTTRDDDVINAGSTVGPTASGRRKPDLAAPGTSITAPNHAWEGFALDHVPKTGTSMAAPMVLGIIMDLMDAGLFDELAIKAVLINTAQKNLPGMDIESDFDGWDPQIGWGYVNAFAAYYHRNDVFTGSVTPRNTDGEYQLYMGSMRDEGASGEGRDRATMTWNRSATYLDGEAPDTFYTLTDLNMRLYRESNNSLLDSDLGAVDNVHQVRVPAGSGDTDVVINAYAWSTTYNNGLASQPFALATEDGFQPVDHPEVFQGIALWPTSVEPNEVFEVEFWLRNDSEIASHNNTFEFNANNGFVLLGGPAITNVGSIQSGSISGTVTYTVRAPANPVGVTSFSVSHSHDSYNVEYGNFNWNLGTTVEVDVTPPNPNPMTFTLSPLANSTTSIRMTAAFASDVHDPIEYYLDYVSTPSGGFGGSDSGWQLDRLYTDTGLQANDEYCYRAWARDNAATKNLTSPSGNACAYTLQNIPAQVLVSSVTNSSVTVQPGNTPNNLTLDASALRINELVTGQSSGWQQSVAPFTVNGLMGAQSLKFQSVARNGDGIETGSLESIVATTLANPPAANSLTALSETAIRARVLPNNNESAQYLIQNTTAGTSSGWSSSLVWDSAGLACGTSYNFQAKARNQDGIETITVPLGVQSTNACTIDTDGDGIEDDADNCTLVSNADQRDTNGDGYGNACDPDLNNDGTVNFVDISLFSASFPSSGVNLDEDFNGDNLVNFVDYLLFSTYFLDPPGPSGVAP